MIEQNIALIGFQACGKTAIGRLVANYLQRPFFDTDLLIEQHHPSLKCSEIYKAYGETYFRDLESQVIQQLQDIQNALFAIGGGTLVKACNQLSLQKHSRFIYLKTDFAILKERILKRSLLPAYLDPKDPLSSLKTFYMQRILLYEKLAHVTIDMQELTFRQAMEKVVEAIQI
jgi:shikimate kinase